MKVSIHQPNVFPWLGYFDKMRQADRFILLDTVQFTKNSYQNRTQILTSHGVKWLTIPVVKEGLYGVRTDQVFIANTRLWQKEHFNILHEAYRQAPMYEARIELIRELYDSSAERLTSFSIPGIRLIKEMLQIDTELILASELPVVGTKSEYLAQLVNEVGGTVYLSGPSGRQYLDESVFHALGILVEYVQYDPIIYPQRGQQSFTNGLSALDYVFEVAECSWKEKVKA